MFGGMKKINLIAKTLFVGLILISSFDSVSAQCGNFLKSTYSSIYKLHPSAVNPTLIRLDDWNNDDRSDLWSMQFNQATNTHETRIYYALPDGYWDWENPVIYQIPFVLTKTQVHDFNGDGRMDLFAVNEREVYINNGNGSLILSTQLNDSGGSVSSNSLIGFIDLNDDNRLDWIYTREGIKYQLQNKDGTFGSQTTILAPSPEYGTSFVSNKLGDFDGDGKTDIVYNTSIGSTVKSVLLKNLGNGNFQPGTPVENDLYVFKSPVVDFNNDGRDDLLSRNVVFFGRTDGGFDRFQLSGGSNTLYNMTAVKMNADANWDIIEIESNYYAVYTGDGTGGFTRTVYTHNFPLTTDGWKLEDFNNDGKADLFIGDEQKSNILGNPLVSIRENYCQSSGETKLANFDGNITPDLITWNPNNGNWLSKNAVWSDTDSESARSFQWGLGSLGDVPAPGDYDGDGKTDYAVYRKSTGVWYVLNSFDSSWYTIRFGLEEDIPIPNDYDGGGKTDIAVFRPSDGNWYLWISETQQFQVLHFGLDGDKPTPADYDGDGKTDVAVFRPSTGVWYYLNSSDYSFGARQWGISNDTPLPADYDGDGRADFAVNRNGTDWWITLSDTNSYTLIQFGINGDIPLPVYRNGISADLVVFRPSNNSFYSVSNGPITRRIGLGGINDAPVKFGLPND